MQLFNPKKKYNKMNIFQKQRKEGTHNRALWIIESLNECCDKNIEKGKLAAADLY